MGTRAGHTDRPELTSLLGDLAGHAERLLGQQYELLKSELRQTVEEAGGTALAAGAGVGLLAVSGVLSVAAAVHLLRRVTGLPLWACYGLMAGATGAGGVGLLSAARTKAADLQSPLLPQSRAALRENVTWLREQLTTTLA